MATQHEVLAGQLATIFAARDNLDTAAAHYLAEAVSRRVTFDENGIASDLPAIVAAVREENADVLGFFKPAASEDVKLAKIPPASAGPRPMSLLPADTAAARARAEHEKQANISAIKAAGNPWMPGSWSVTRQGILANSEPDLADRLRAEAQH